MIWILLFKHRDVALAANGINSLTALIVEDIVAITDCAQALDSFPCIRVEYEQSCREPSHDEQPVVGLIERHWIIRQCPSTRTLFEQDLCHHALVLMTQQMTVEDRHASYEGVGKVHYEVN